MATSNPASVPAPMPANLAGWTLQRLPEAPPENLEDLARFMNRLRDDRRESERGERLRQAFE